LCSESNEDLPKKLQEKEQQLLKSADNLLYYLKLIKTN